MAPVQWHEALQLVDAARQHDSPLIQRMIAIKAHYNSDVVLPTFDVPGEDAPQRSPSPLLIADAIDKNAMRAASVMPSISFQGGTSAMEQKRVRRRRGAMQAVWHQSGLTEVGMGRLFRHLFGYATMSAVAVMRDGMETPIIEVRDPLTTYSENKAPEDFSPPKYTAYVYGKSVRWIKKHYPETEAMSLFEKTNYADPNTIWDVMEYIDEDQVMIGVLGPRQQHVYNSSSDFTTWRQDTRSLNMMLRRWNNWAGMVPGTTVHRVTLDRVESSVMKLTDMVNEIGRLRTLEKIAAERGVFPDMVAFGDNAEPPSVVGGQWMDGRDGVVNELMNAKGFQVVRMDPSVVSRQVTDMMEGAFGQSAGLDPLSTGHSRQSLRTGQALNAMAGYSLDPQIMEAQRVCARLLSTVNTGAMELWKNHPLHRAKKVSLFTGKAGNTEMVDFTPAKDITSSHNSVYYPMPGADITSIQVALGQAMQTGQMSTKTARAANPLIDNEEFEERQIVVEQIEQVLMQALATQAQNPQDGATLVDMAEILEDFRRNGDVGAAIRRADELARERQANAAPDPLQQVGGLDPGNPGAVAGGPGGGQNFPGPTSNGDALQRLTRNLNARPTDRASVPTPVGA